MRKSQSGSETCKSKKTFLFYRPLVDSGTDLGDREGVFLTSCVTILVGEAGAERRVVQQSVMPGHTHCTDIFIESWELLLNAKWNQVRQQGLTGLLISLKLCCSKSRSNAAARTAVTTRRALCKTTPNHPYQHPLMLHSFYCLP